MDKAEDRNVICEALATAGIPFVVTGVSPVLDTQVRLSIRTVTAYTDVSSWEGAIPQVGQAGQDQSMDLVEVTAGSLTMKFNGVNLCQSHLELTSHPQTYDDLHISIGSSRDSRSIPLAQNRRKVWVYSRL